MATTETALALSDYADYLIASEETEPGTGWYYTNWLSNLSSNTAISTLDLGKKIVDDFIDESNRSARGMRVTEVQEGSLQLFLWWIWPSLRLQFQAAFQALQGTPLHI